LSSATADRVRFAEPLIVRPPPTVEFKRAKVLS
jgi:hypothetical protein